MIKIAPLFLLLATLACESPTAPDIVDTDDDQVVTVITNISIVNPPPKGGDVGKGSNSPPVVQHPGDQTSDVGEVVSLQILAADPDGDPLTYRIINPPRGFSIDQNGLVRGAASTSSHEDSPFETSVAVNDGQQVTTVTFTWTVPSPPEV